MLRCDPAVFAVGKNYQIIATTKSQALVSVKIGGKIFVDDSNGILRSASRTHNIEVPQSLLNECRHYTVIEKPIIKRLPYFTKTKDDKYYEYDFRPVESDKPVCYHIADAHNDSVNTVKAALAFGKMDFLILNGDIPNDSGNTKNFDTIFDICARVTHGEFPIVFARGNHDLRGICAEKFAEYAPRKDGKTYYTFRLGKIWGIILDCGEDKTDDHAEYGFTVACHQFREKETEFIKKVISDKENEYKEADVGIKLVICHLPFTRRFEPPFDIEPEIYTEWARLLKEEVKPDLMICGHTHRIEFYEPGGKYDTYGQPCRVVVAAAPDGVHKIFRGGAFVFGKDECDFISTDSTGKKYKKKTISYR